MDCQNTVKNLKINLNKTIGDVVIVVEGEEDEFRLLKHIFTKIFKYNYVTLKRNKVMKCEFVSENNKNTIIVANTKNSNISSLRDDNEYKEKLYKILNEEYKRNLKNVPIYILWDRDKVINNGKDTTKHDYELAIETFSSAMDNEYEMNGLLLLSYPCHECFNLSNFEKRSWKNLFFTSNECKVKFNKSQFCVKDINENSLKLAVENMHQGLLDYGIRDYDPSDFKNVNKSVFRKEEEQFKNSKCFDSLSLLSIMLVDLGLIYEEI